MSSVETKPAVPPIVQQILRGRGLDEGQITQFVYPSYAEDLHDPFLMTGMQAAIDRILLAARRDERVVVYGDYDIDGMTASAIMIEGLAANGIEVSSYIPDRFEEGYGINQAALEQLKASGVDLVISVDCGITSVAEAAWARENGLDLVITDHHTPAARIPEAMAVVNPKQPGDRYPFKDLCGAGVAFKLVQALQRTTGKPAGGQEKWLLDLVALGTVCDVVDLVGENRVLVSYGLKVLRQSRRPGIASLAAVGGVRQDQLGAYHLGYVLGPRLNAAGRLEHASQALELLQTNDAGRAGEIAVALDALNLRRRSEQTAAFEAAEVLAQDYADDPVLVLASPDWSHGIVGIVASKLVERFGKPVLVAQILGQTTKGSARSVGSFNMVEALRANEALLTKFGGHFFAAGYTLATADLDKLRAGLNDYYRLSGAAPDGEADLSPDLRLSGLGEVTWPTYEALALLEPHGAGNPAPLVAIDGITLGQASRVGQGAKHLRVSLADGTGTSLGGIGFGLGERLNDLKSGESIVALGRLDINEYQGARSLQLIVNDIKA